MFGWDGKADCRKLYRKSCRGQHPKADAIAPAALNAATRRYIASVTDLQFLKKLYRFYREEGLTVRKRGARKRASASAAMAAMAAIARRDTASAPATTFQAAQASGDVPTQACLAQAAKDMRHLVVFTAPDLTLAFALRR